MKNNKILNVLFYAIFLLSMIAYEIHLYSYYTYVQLSIFALNIIAFIIFLNNKTYFKEMKKNIKQNKIVILLCFFMMISTLISMVKFKNIQIYNIAIVLMFIINIILYFFSMPIYCKYNKKFENTLNNFIIIFITIISILGIIIVFRKNFLGYTLFFGRARSIYFDPNFFSVIAAIPCALIFRKNYKFKIKILVLTISLIAIFYSNSRGTMLSISACMIYYIFIKYPNKNILNKILIIICFFSTFLIFFNYLNKIDFFREEQGSNGRDKMIEYSINKIKDSPITGFGYGMIDDLLKNEGMENASTHNSLIDYMMIYGIPCLILFLVIIFKSFCMSFKEREKLYLNLLTILLFMNMNTILFSFGGVGFPSIILSLCIGMSCNRLEYKF